MLSNLVEETNREKIDAVELCLDFANTMTWHASGNPHENLHSYADLLAWAARRELIDASQAERLETLSARDEAQAEATLRRAIELREVIYRLFAAQAHDQAAQLDDVQLLNEALIAVASKARIERVGDTYLWSWVGDDELDRMLWPIVRSAGDLLTNEALLRRVGQCADDRGCGWLFLDLSKNHSRRWCDINDCGNRAKQRRFQQRLREEKRP